MIGKINATENQIQTSLKKALNKYKKKNITPSYHTLSHEFNFLLFFI
ncbi:hypothetical protein BOM_1136 (plasmid) [Borrelia miyamotoi FR64b]|uniref:Uncharacterized protein n=1 Tax=Borrelia miyamotoi FR64b TaxID=1292392 RepID=W5SEZ6_9SPIR|nr:hypothetical protein BOM_1136 [Borrelia miyamotoi FR64b]